MVALVYAARRGVAALGDLRAEVRVAREDIATTHERIDVLEVAVKAQRGARGPVSGTGNHQAL